MEARGRGGWKEGEMNYRSKGTVVYKCVSRTTDGSWSRVMLTFIWLHLQGGAIVGVQLFIWKTVQ